MLIAYRQKAVEAEEGDEEETEKPKRKSRAKVCIYSYVPSCRCGLKTSRICRRLRTMTIRKPNRRRSPRRGPVPKCDISL
jgi:hypothetical protein